MIFAMMLAVSNPAPAEQPGTSTARPVPERPATERVICRTVERTGSRLGSRRICRTVSDQRLADEQAAEQTRDMQRESGGGVDLSGPGA